MKREIQSYICGQIISVCNSERIIKIGLYLRKLCSNKKGSSLVDGQCTFFRRFIYPRVSLKRSQGPGMQVGAKQLESLGYRWRNLHDSMVISFDGRTDRRTDGHAAHSWTQTLEQPAVPASLRQSVTTVGQFKKLLKTHLFS